MHLRPNILTLHQILLLLSQAVGVLGLDTVPEFWIVRVALPLVSQLLNVFLNNVLHNSALLILRLVLD